MNFTTRPPSACTMSLTEPPNSVSRSSKSVGSSTCVSAVKPVRSANPTPHVTFADASVMTCSKWVRALTMCCRNTASISTPKRLGDLRDRAICLRRGEFVAADGHQQVGLRHAHHRPARFGEPGHRVAEHPQKRECGVIADERLDRHPRRQSVDVGLAQRERLRVGDRQAHRRPGVSRPRRGAHRAPRRPCAGCRSGGPALAERRRPRPNRRPRRSASTISSAVNPSLSRYSIRPARSRALAIPAASSASKSTTVRVCQVSSRTVDCRERSPSRAPSRNVTASSAPASPNSAAG